MASKFLLPSIEGLLGLQDSDAASPLIWANVCQGSLLGSVAADLLVMAECE